MLLSKISKKNSAKKPKRRANAAHADAHRVIDLRVHDVDKPQFAQLGKHNARRQPERKRQSRRKERLPAENAGDVAFAHAQYIIHPKLAASATHQKGIGIEEKQGGKHTDHDRSKTP